MKGTQTIVPVQLMDNQSMQTNNYPEVNSKPHQVVCQLTMNGAEIQFYNGVDKHILHAVLAEVRNAR